MNNENIKFYLDLDKKNLIAKSNAIEYIMPLTTMGPTTMKFGYGTEINIPCPFPEKLIQYKVLYFALKIAKYVPLIVLTCLCLVVTQALLWSVYPTGSINFSKISFIDTACSFLTLSLNSALIILLILTFLSISIYNFKKGLVIDLSGQVSGLLESGDKTISIAPDILVYQNDENEKPDVFSEKVREAIEDIKPGVMLVVIYYRFNDGVIVCKNENNEEVQLIFSRETPPFDIDAKIPSNGFLRETFGEYLLWIKAFSNSGFSKWSQTNVIKNGGNPLRSMTNRIKNTAVLIAFCATFCAAQNIQTVAKYMGSKFNDPAGKQEVCFQFEKGNVCVNGDGTKTYAQLLSSYPGFSDNANIGGLIGVTEGKHIIVRVEASDKPSPRTMLPTINGSSLPDSAKFANSVQQSVAMMNRDAPRIKSIAGLSIIYATAWFDAYVAVWILLILIISAIFAWASADESRINQFGFAIVGKHMLSAHQFSSFLIMILGCIIIIRFAIGLYASSICNGYNIYFMALLFIVVAAIASKVLGMFIPNSKIVRSDSRDIVNRDRF